MKISKFIYLLSLTISFYINDLQCGLIVRTISQLMIVTFMILLFYSDDAEERKAIRQKLKDTFMDGYYFGIRFGMNQSIYDVEKMRETACAMRWTECELACDKIIKVLDETKEKITEDFQKQNSQKMGEKNG